MNDHDTARADLITDAMCGLVIGRGRKSVNLAEILLLRMQALSPDADRECRQLANSIAKTIASPDDLLPLMETVERIVGDYIDRDPDMIQDRVSTMAEIRDAWEEVEEEQRHEIRD